MQRSSLPTRIDASPPSRSSGPPAILRPNASGAGYEQFDDTPVVSATLRVRLARRSGQHIRRVSNALRARNNTLLCMSSACDGGQYPHRRAKAGAQSRSSVGGKLKSGRFIGHYIHLDKSCEGRVGGPIVLESGEDDRRFSLLPAPKEACR